MSYHPSHAGTHHANFLTAGMPINYAHNHNATASPNTNASLLASNISSHSFPMAPSPNNGTPQPQQQQQQQQTQIQQQAQVQQQQQQQQQQATVAVAQQQQQQQPGTSVPPGVPDQEGLIAPPSMPLELDFDNLESASNYMHTYALSQGFDIRIQWSANNQTRICWSCYRGGFPETLNADGTPNTKKRQIPKEKERRKRGSLKIGCPFRVQCTKNWKTGKMELRILEGRHKHQMETDRENLPSQVRRIKSQRKGQDSPGTPQTGNAAANAVAQAANLTSTPTPAPSSSASGSQAGAKGRANAASKNGNANRNGTANASQAQRNQSQQQQAQQQQQADRSSSAPQNLLVNAAGPSAHQQLSLLGTPTPSNGAATAFDLDTDDVISDPVSSAQQVVDFQRRMLAILGLYDRSDSASRAIMDRELESMTSGAEARLNKPGRNKRKMGPNGNVLDPATSGLAALGAGTPTSNGSIAALARTAWNGNVNANAAATGTPRANPVNGIGSPLRTTAGSVGVSVPQTPLAQLASQQQTAPPSSGKGSARCSNCKEYGHNRRRCPLG